MTVLFSAVSEQGVVVSADSAVSNDFGAFTEYTTDRKLWHVPNCGFVASWGARVGMNLGPRLATEWADADGRSASDLARFVHEYLVSEFRPDESGEGDVGFHVGGLGRTGEPALFHSYFEVTREFPNGRFDLQSLLPSPGNVQFLYNGRNDIVHSYLQPILDEIRGGRDTRFRADSLPALAQIAHFIMRVISEITPGVGPPYILGAITRGGPGVRRRYEAVLEPFERFRADFG